MLSGFSALCLSFVFLPFLQMSSSYDLDPTLTDSILGKPYPPTNTHFLSKNYWGPSDAPISPLFIRATSLPPRKRRREVFDVEYEPDTKPLFRDDVIDDVAHKSRVYSRARVPRVPIYSEIFKPMYETTVLSAPNPRRFSKPITHHRPVLPKRRAASVSLPTPTFNPPPRPILTEYVRHELYPGYPHHEFIRTHSSNLDLRPSYERETVEVRPRQIFTHRHPVKIGTQVRCVWSYFSRFLFCLIEIMCLVQ